jgi:outer membrane protein insertion porin family
MRMHFFRALVLTVLVFGLFVRSTAAQAPTNPAQVAGQTAAPSAITVCDQAVAAPANLPPAGSGPVVWLLAPCFLAQGGSPTIDVDTYLFYIKLQVSRPNANVWVPYDDKAEELMRADFKALWGTNFLENLSIEVTDYAFANGVVGKIVQYHMEERERVKIVDYRNDKGESVATIKRTDIDEKLREARIELRLDSFLDEGTIRRVKSVLDEMMAEKGFTNAEITHTVTPVAGGPKLVNVTFHLKDGPKIKIKDIEFVGNTAISDGTLQGKLKENKPKGILSFITGTGTYKESMFEEDAARVTEFYRNEGYVRARIGQPELRVLEDTTDGETRWVQLRIPVTEGPRYRLGQLTFEGNKLIRSEFLRPLYEIKEGDWYSFKKLQDGNRKAQELIYGRNGYMEFTPFPDISMSDDVQNAAQALDAQVPDALLAPETKGPAPAPVADIVMRYEEGPQYLVNRITFKGNTTTRDNVIRRELRLLEGNVFDTEALKYSVRRLNQLGYFRTVEENNTQAIDVQKNASKENTVDVTLNLEEQNRNQLTFGAGVSQFEGVFGQLAFQTANFLGRGESLTVQMTAGDRSQNYQLAFTEPFLFDRNITGGFDLYKRSLQYINYYTQKSAGGNLFFGFPVADFSRMIVSYAYETTKIGDLNEALIDPSCVLRSTGCSLISSLADLSRLSDEQRRLIERNPFLLESLLVGQGGKRTISKVQPSFVHNTVDNPIFPNTGKRLTAAVDLAVLGGNTRFYKPSIEGIWFFRHLARTSVGMRGQFQYISPVGTDDPRSLPVFERLFLGGEYSVRGYDIRSIGPTVEGSQVVLGGNKSLLFNAEYLISIASQVRIVLFYDAGQVRDFGERFSWKEPLLEPVDPVPPPLIGPGFGSLIDPSIPEQPTTRVVGETSAFKTSTGVELRFFMPVLNVPFRLIYSLNPQRGNVLDNSFRPAKDSTFRFAVGTTF